MDAITNDRMNATDNEIVISRIFEAPRALVWRAWTDPRHVVHWWGPNGFRTTIQEMDVRPGGVWRHVMHGPDGVDYPNESVFLEVVMPERIVYAHGGGRKGDAAAHFEATWTFESLGEHRTRLTIRMVFPTAAERDMVAKEYGAIEGAQQTLERLACYLPHVETCQIEPGKADLVLTRIFDAPRELVFKAWTDPEQLAQWWGPRGFTAPHCMCEARAGGVINIHMRGPQGSIFDRVMPMKGLFLEVDFPERLVFTTRIMDDEAGNPQLEVLHTVTFEALAHKTKITLNAVVIKSTPAVADAIAGMQQGWTESIEKLAAMVQGFAA